MRTLRVLIVAPSLGILGGQAVQADRLIAYWRGDPDIDVRLQPVNPPPPKPLSFVRRMKYVRTAVTELMYVPQLLQRIAWADVVHVFSASYSSFYVAPLPAMLIARVLGRPVLMNYRSGAAPDHLRRSTVARRAIAAADRNVVPSVFLRDVFAQLGIETTIIPNVVDLDRFEFRSRTPVAPRLLSTRNFEPLYNVACTVRAFRIVQDHQPDAALTLVGSGSEERRLRQLTAELHLERVTFAGRIPQNEIHRYYANHDIYIQSPNIDNMPGSVLEAYASGLPVVATEAGGVPAMLTDGVHGLLTPLDDHRRLADHVLRLLSDQDLATRLAKAAFERCQSYTWSAVRPQWLRVYRQLAAERTGAPAAAPAS